MLAYSPFFSSILANPEIRNLPKANLIFPDFGLRGLKTLVKFLYTGEVCKKSMPLKAFIINAQRMYVTTAFEPILSKNGVCYACNKIYSTHYFIVQASYH